MTDHAPQASAVGSRRDNSGSARSSGGSNSQGPPARRGRSRQRRGAGELHFLRYVPGDSVLHRSWAGSKILLVVALSITILFQPTWQAAGLFTALLLAGVLASDLPRTVLPKPPLVVYAILAVGPLLALWSGGAPYLVIGTLHLGFGGLREWSLAILIALDILGAASLLGWTTPLADLAPALGRLLGPLGRVRVPVSEFIATLALSIRCLPLLAEELRILRAARRIRRPAVAQDLRTRIEDLGELLVTALSSALRRASELADAIEARGGVGTSVPETHDVARIDALLLGLGAVVVVAMALVH